MLKLLILLAIGITPHVTSFHLNSEDNNLVSLKQFTVYHKLGNGGTFLYCNILPNYYSNFFLKASGSVVHLARKNGGSDDGKLYALKEVPRNDFLKNEREVRQNPTDIAYII